MMQAMTTTWHNINEEDAVSFNFLYPFIDVYPRHFYERFGFVPRVAMEIRKDHVRYNLHDSFIQDMPKLYQWLAKKPNFEKLDRKVCAESDALHAASDATVGKNIKDMTDSELAYEATALSDLLCSCIGWGLLPPLIDFGGEHISKAALSAIETQVRMRKLKTHPSEYFVTLTTPTDDTLTRQEERSILRLALDLREKNGVDKTGFSELEKKHPDLAKKIREHASRFIWTYFGYCGPALTPEKTVEKALERAQKDDVPARIKKQAGELPALLKRQRQYEQELAMDAEQKWAVHVARESVRLKTVRKDAMVHCAYALDAILREVARRTGIPLSHLRAAKSDELGDILSGKLPDEKLATRHAHLVYLSEQDGVQLLEGPDAEHFAKTQFKELDVSASTHVSGQCAQPGKATGRVKIIDKAEQMHKMNDGDILVSIATTPEIVPAMKKAAAIVTEIGGITSHAAIVSRELGVPCVIGTKIATKWLKDGDKVEVDATNGIVRKH